MMPGSLIGAWIAARAGVRRATVIGLLLFAVSIVGFGFGTSIVTLDALRFLQGAACGFIWGGGLTWVIAVAPRERRGEMLGIGDRRRDLRHAARPRPRHRRRRGRAPARCSRLVGAISLGLAPVDRSVIRSRRSRPDAETSTPLRDCCRSLG